jgi:NAD(P)-dependent dehydrogenase (short-subunit alcohol dehydrogenase family)
MDLKLAGKRALVTGSSAGLGEAIAKLLAAEGVAVIIHGRDESRAKAVAHAIRAEGGCAEITLGDLGTDAGRRSDFGGARRRRRRHPSQQCRRVPPSLLDGSNAGSLDRNLPVQCALRCSDDSSAGAQDT